MAPSLAERLRRRIRREGPISFADFMEAALYDPEEGYYSGGAAIGEGGDFVTSPAISPAFARTIARVFATDAEDLFRWPGRPSRPSLVPEGEAEVLDFVEVGAGEGSFLADFAEALRRESPSVAERTRLLAIERGRAGRERLAGRGIEVFPELSEGSVRGWIFANELYDALPVARLRGSEAGLEELRVGLDDDRLTWTAVAAPREWKDHLARFGVSLEPGQIAEVCPGAAELHRRLARALSYGRLVLFDYGHRARTLYHPLARRGGTLAVHRAGRRGGDPLDRIGEQDLTAHVNWDELLAVGEQEGLRSEGPIRQGRFLTGAGIFDFAGSEAEKWRIYRLVDPGGMGEEISVLVQSRGMRPLEFGFCRSSSEF